MRRLSQNEITDLQFQFSQWHQPKALHDIVEETNAEIGSVTLFNQAGLAFLRDAWLAAEFGIARKAQFVRLVSDRWPDFEVKIDDQIELFEAVEADDPHRRRGDEYRDSTGEVEDDPFEDWIARADQAQTWIEISCRKKLAKQYGGKANLIIYLNLSEYGVRQKEIESCFQVATEDVRDSFSSVWVYWKNRAYLVWNAGKAVRCL